MKRYVRILFLFPLFLVANPQREERVFGDFQLLRSEKTLEVKQISDRGILNWEDFSIHLNETTHFHQPNSTSAILNRVTGNKLSEIHGSLTSNGMVYLVNPNGIVIGPEGRIHTTGFLASTLNVLNAEFLDADIMTFHGTSKGVIKQKGEIKCSSGNIFLIAQKIEHCGKMSGDTVHEIAATEVILCPEGEHKYIRMTGLGSIEDSGVIEAIQAEIQASGSVDHLAINHSGVIHVKGFEEREGRIVLSAQGDLQISGSLQSPGGIIHVLGEKIVATESAFLDVSSYKSGGKILIGGDYQGENPLIQNANSTYIAEGALFKADAMDGNGGKVIIQADDVTEFYGHISAQAIGESGDGGFAEVSGRNHLWISGHADLRAKNGDYGTMLCDPGPVTINNGAGVGPDTFGEAFIIAQLGLGNFTITTASGTLGGAETLTFSGGGGAANITWADNTTFSAIGRRNTVINSGVVIQNNGSGSIDIQGNANASGASYFGVNMLGGTIGVTNGNISITGTGGDTLNSNIGVFIGGGATLSASNASTITINGTAGPGATNNRGVYLQGPATSLTSSSGEIRITGIGNGTTNNNIGIEMDGGAAVSSTSGAIVLNGTGGSGNIGCQGVNLNTATLSNASGDINMTGVGGGTAGASYGVILFGDSSTSITTTTGNINIIGTGGPGSDSQAVLLRGLASGNLISVNSVDGNIFIQGTGTGAGVNNSGVTLFNNGAEIFTTGTGSITIVGTGSGGPTGGLGFQLNATGNRIRTANPAATISITGQGSNDFGIRLDGGDNLGDGTPAPIILTADSVNLQGLVQGDGITSTVTVQPIDPASPMGVGPSAPGTLVLNATDLANLTGFTLQTFGRSDGTSTLSTDLFGFTPSRDTILRNNNIDILAPVTVNNFNLTMNIGTGGNGALNLYDNIVTTGGAIQVNGAGAPETNTFNAFNNTVNTWDILTDNAGTFASSAGFTAGFSNVGNLVGGNMDDTFIFANQQGVSGLIDGGAPPAVNTLDYTGWNPAALVQFVGSYDGVASNITDGFFNIFQVIGNVTDTIVPEVNVTFINQVNLSFRNLFLEGKDDDVFSFSQHYLIWNVIAFPNALWLDISANVEYQRLANGLQRIESFRIEQDVPPPVLRAEFP